MWMARLSPSTTSPRRAGASGFLLKDTQPVDLLTAVRGIAESNDALSRELRETIEAESPRLGLDVSFVERTGNPYREIVRLATELRVDALIIGASTQAGHRIVGSLATHLVRDAKWPVIVVP